MADKVSLWDIKGDEQIPAHREIVFVCPGCGDCHCLPIDGDKSKHPVWTWNGDLESPTLSPSILARFKTEVCHSFVTDGKIQFLSDCTHELAGQTVSLFDVSIDKHG